MSDDAAEIEEIKRLKARYFRFLDTKQWDRWGEILTADATLDTTAQSPVKHGVLEGRQHIVDYLSEHLTDGVVSCHHGHMPEIEILSPTTARGVWAMEDRIWAPEGSALGFRRVHGYGHYHETYEKVDGRWLIATLQLTRLRVDIQRS